MLLATSIALLTILAEAQSPSTVPPVANSRMVEAYLQAQQNELIEARGKRVARLQTADEINAYRAEQRAYLLGALGPFPERTPLNARVVGQAEADGYRYEKVIFESRPNFFVTAILYLPNAAGPVPGVIVPCGHSQNGKALEAYQRASILLAKNGIAALCYDPIGQGERVYFTKSDGSAELGATIEHTLIGADAILLGTNLAAYRIWDGMRALDYLQTRPEIDPKHLGCTGNSGGGTLTSYLMALDERIDCAAASCYLTSFRQLLHTIGPQDAEQNIFGEIAHGFDHADFIHLRTPKATLICSATRDFFDIQGTWDTFREAKQVLTKLGYPERVDLMENDDKHGFNRPQREAMVRWMRRWLAGKDEPVFEQNFPVHSDAELQCTPTGQVKDLPSARSIFDVMQAREAELAKARAAANLAPEALRKAVAEKVGYVPQAFDMPLYSAADPGADGSIPMTIAPEMPRPRPADAPADRAPNTKDIVNNALLFPSKGELKAVTICLRAGGVVDSRDDADAIRSDAENGIARLYLDLRGTGASRPDTDDAGWANTVGHEWPSFFNAYLLGKSFTGMWVTDIVAAAKVARHALGKPDAPVRLDARGFTTIPAAHAAALEPGLLAIARLEGGIASWRDVIMTPRAKQQLYPAVHGALEAYDLDMLPKLWANADAVVTAAAVPTF